MGQYDTHGGYFAPQGYTRINTGGSHEENPNGGVQLGVDAQGIPNMLEEGEPVYNDFVYSDNIKTDAEILKKHGIPTKFAGKLYSVIADYYVEEANRRPLDPISNNGLNAMLTRLAEAQEEQKQLETQQELEEQLAQMSPEEQEQLRAMLDQQNAQGQMQEGVPREAAMQGMPQGEPAMMPQGQSMSPEEAMMMQQPMQAQAPQMMPQQPMMMANGGLIRRFDAGSPQGTLVTHRLAGTEDLDRFYNPQSYSLTVGDTAQQQSPEVETIMATTPPVYFNPDDTGTTRGGYMEVDGNGNLIADIEPAVVTAFPGKSQAWVDAEVGPRSIKKKVSEGINDAMYDAIDIYENSLLADPFTHAAYSVAKGNYGDAALDLGLAAIPGIRSGSRAVKSAEKGVREAKKAADRTAKIVKARETTSAAKSAVEHAKKNLDASEAAISNIEREINDAVKYRETLDNVVDKKEVTSHINDYAKQYDDAVQKAKQAKKELKSSERSVSRAERKQNLQETLHPDAAKRADSAQANASTASNTNGTSAKPKDGTTNQSTSSTETTGGATETTSDGGSSTSGASPKPKLTKKEKWIKGSKITGWTLLGGGVGTGIGFGIDALVDAYKNPLDNPYKVDSSVYNLDFSRNRNKDANNHALGGPIRRFAPGGTLTTLPRYAGIANSAIATLYNAVQKPDHYEIPQYNPILPTVSAPAYITPEYRPTDVNMLSNAYLADAAGNRRAVLNAGAGPSTAAQLVGLGYNSARNFGTFTEQTRAANNTQRNQLAQLRNSVAESERRFNDSMSQFRAESLNMAKLRNIQNYLMQQQLNYQAEGQKYAALQSNLNSMSKDLAGIGTENWNMNMINQNPYFQYGVGFDGSPFYNPNYAVAQQTPIVRTPPLESLSLSDKAIPPTVATTSMTPSGLAMKGACGGFIRRIKK